MTESPGSAEGGRLDRSGLARVVVRGTDAKDFLHRLTSNDVAGLAPGEGCATLLLERTGRVVDRLIACNRGTDLLLIGSRGRGEAVLEWLRRYVIAEDVRVEDLARESRLITVLGGKAPEVLAARLGVAAGELAPYHHRPAERPEGGVLVVRAEDVGGRSFHVVVPAAVRDLAWEMLDDLPVIDEATYDALRIEAGVPAFGAEYDGKTIPLETRMLEAIHFAKGCYVGQEVIARLHRQDRVKRSLVRLRIEGDGVPGEGALLAEGERRVGIVTSTAVSGGTVYALGYVEKEYAAPGRRLALRGSGGNREAEVLTLTPAGDPERGLD